MDMFFERLEKYCSIPGPSGMEKEVRKQIIEDIKKSGAKITVDPNGNLIVFKKGHLRRDKKLLVAAHMDEVGFMIKYINDDGYMLFGPIGGIDRRVVSGRRISFCHNGKTGIIASKAIHMQKKEERGMCESIDEMSIDVGCNSKETASEIANVGDCAVFQPNFEYFGDGMIKSKALDDRFGCALMVDLINSDLEYDTYFAFDTCEEVGCLGAQQVAHQIKPDISIILESTTAGDVEGTPEGRYACELRKGAVISHTDGSTIYDKELVQMALSIGKENSVPCQLKNIVAGGNEARAYQRGFYGSRVLAISAPTRYIHSASSVCAKEDLLAVGELTKLLIERKI